MVKPWRLVLWGMDGSDMANSNVNILTIDKGNWFDT
jgi:hypothetical protein